MSLGQSESSACRFGLATSKNRLVRTVSPRNPEKSIISQVSQDNILPQMDNPENQQGLYEPPQHGGNATLPINPVLG